MTYGIRQQRKTDGPDDGGGQTLQQTTNDEKSKSGAETKQEGGAKEGEESDEERQTSGGRVVSKVAAYGCQSSVCGRSRRWKWEENTASSNETGAIDGKEDGDPVLDCI